MFYDNLLYECTKRGKTVAQVITEMGINRSQITKWKNGARPQTATAQRIAEYIGCSFIDLMVDKDKLSEMQATKKEQVTTANSDLSLNEMTKELLSYIATTDDEETIRLVYSVVQRLKK